MKLLKFAIIILTLSLIGFCKGKKSSEGLNDNVSAATGWAYNDPSNGGYLRTSYEEQETGPNLVFIEGGTFTMGRTEEDLRFDWSNSPRRVTVNSFYIDETEVTNQFWIDYLHWIGRTYPDYKTIMKKALPDTLVWRSKLGYHEPKIEQYLRHPAYKDYPVVGVSWLQATQYCNWRTDRVNERRLINEGYLKEINDQTNDPFTTDSYIAGQWTQGDQEKGMMVNYDPKGGEGVVDEKGKVNNKNLGKRRISIQDGLLLPKYRLPTEAEWEYAAYGLIGNTTDGNVKSRKIYPWNGHWVRNPDKNFRGQMMANFKLGKGDYMGAAGNLNDGHAITGPVNAFWPNDYGLYCMAGNVAEWVNDVFRPLSTEDVDDFSPFRGNVFRTKVLNSEGNLADKTDETMYDAIALKEWIADFRTARKARKGGLITDSLDFMIIDRVDTLISKSVDMQMDGRHLEASRNIKEIIDVYFFDVSDDISSKPGLEDFELTIIPKIIDGISLFVINTPGNIKIRNVSKEENLNRRNYIQDDYIDYLDGDIQSSIYYKDIDTKNKVSEFEDQTSAERNRTGFNPDNLMYQSSSTKNASGVEKSPSSLIHDASRVYKGGSWKDRAYWMNPGARRYYDEDKSTDFIGFRCAMDRVGNPRKTN